MNVPNNVIITNNIIIKLMNAKDAKYIFGINKIMIVH